MINLGTFLFLFMQPFFSFPANYVIDNYGIKESLYCGDFFILLGCGLRCLVNYNFIYFIIGQTLIGMGVPFVVNGIGKLSNNWYFPQNRQLVTSLISLMTTLSAVIGLVISGIAYYGYNHENDTEDFSEGKSISENLMIFEFIMSFVCMFPNMIFMQNKPPTPPSRSAEAEKEDAVKSLKVLLKSKNYWLILNVMGVFFGGFLAVNVNLSFIIAPFGFESFDVSLIGISKTFKKKKFILNFVFK
jgi:hypothetical protein